MLDLDASRSSIQLSLSRSNICLTLIETDTRSTKVVAVAALVQQEH